jgi:hypothetical protein
VWRRFKLKADFVAGVIGGFIPPTGRVRGTNSLNGTGGLTGRTDASLSRPTGSMFELTGDLPCLDGYDWTTQDPIAADKTRRNAPSMAFAPSGPALNDWTTLAEQCGSETMDISVDSDLAAITFGSAASEVLWSMWEDTVPVYVTLGLKGQFNDAMSWCRDTPSFPRDQKRIFSKARPQLSKKIVPKGTVVGVVPVGSGSLLSGSLQIVAADVVIHDDTALANSVLGISTAWYANASWSVGFSRTGEIDETFLLPGNMVIEVDHLEGDKSTTAQAVLGVVTAVTFDFNEPGATKFTTKRIPIDVEAII